MNSEIISYLRPDQIEPSPYQHRRGFADSDLRELARSIEMDGLIQPITVRPVNSHFELIAGERRWRAVKSFTAMGTIAARVLNVDDDQARRLCATENLQRSDLSAIEEVSALVDIIDVDLLKAFDDYRTYGNTSVERVRFVLMKLRSDDANRTDFMSKFTHKVDCIFNGLPKPKEWISFATNDLPLLTSIDDEVQAVAVNEKLNKSQTKALQKLKDADRSAFAEAAKKGDDGLIRHVYRNYNDYDQDIEPDEPERLRDLSAERIARAAKTISHGREFACLQQQQEIANQQIDPNALWIWGRVGEIHDFIEQDHSFETLFKRMTPTMQVKLKRQAVTVAKHIAKFGVINE
jgi:hypothetical protein